MRRCNGIWPCYLSIPHSFPVFDETVLFNGLVQWSCSKVLFKGLDERVAMSQLCDVCQPVILLDLRDTSRALCRWTEQKLVTTTPFVFFFVITLHIPQHKQSYNKANWAVTYQFPTDLSSPHSFPVFDNYPVYQLHHLSSGASRVHEPYIRWTPSHRDLSPKPLTQYPCPNHSLT